VEKPLALNLKDLASLKAQTAAHNRVLFTVHNWKHAPLFARLKQLADSGVLGELRHVELHTLRTRPAAAEGGWRSDPASGGLLVDHGWHAFYLLRHLLGQDPRSVTCRPRGRSGVDEEVTLLVEWAGADSVVHLSWAAPFRANWGVAYGTRGTVEIKDDRLVVSRPGLPEEVLPFPRRVSEGSAHPDWFEAMLDDFGSEAADPRRRGANLKEAEACLSLIAHAQQSARGGGRTLPLPAPAAPAARGTWARRRAPGTRGPGGVAPAGGRGPLAALFGLAGNPREPFQVLKAHGREGFARGKEGQIEAGAGEAFQGRFAEGRDGQAPRGNTLRRHGCPWSEGLGEGLGGHGARGKQGQHGG